MWLILNRENKFDVVNSEDGLVTCLHVPAYTYPVYEVVSIGELTR